jgi:flagellar P-ring protein precursor FlgI
LKSSCSGARAAARVAVLTAVLSIAGAAPLVAVPTVRIKEIGSIQGLRENQLVGVGLMTGLAGRGDSSNSAMLRSAIANLMANFGLRVDPEEVRSRNCAVVTVTGAVPPFVRGGDKVDAVVSSLGDARSLEGGVLLLTPLQGANGEVYAVAQGRLVTAGASGRTSTPRTVGTIPGGVVMERDILSTFLQGDTVSILLRNPDFVTANTVAEAVQERFPEITLSATDPSRVEVRIPESRRTNPVGFIAELESIEVTPDPSGKVVIDSSSGVIIFGEQVRIGKVAVSYREVTVNVGASPGAYGGFGSASMGGASGPLFGDGAGQSFAFGETTTVEELVDTLKAIGLGTDAIIPIIQAIDRAGALYGRLVIM